MSPAVAAGAAASVFPGGVPRIGLGLAAIGRPGYITTGRAHDLGAGADRSEAAMRARAEALLDAAWAGGVRWFDCARSYGEAESFVGRWLAAREIDPVECVVSSKWGYRYTAGWRIDTGGEPHEVKDHSLAHLNSQVPETVEAIGPYVKLYQVHSATFDSGVLGDAAVHDALAALRADRGWRLGLSVSGTAQAAVLDAALAIERPAGVRLFDSVQVTFNVFEQAPLEALSRAHAAGCAVVVKEALANGRVLAHAGLRAHAAELGCAVDALALACVLAQPFEPFVLSGAATPEQLASNLGAHHVAESLRADPRRLAAIMADCRQDSQEYWTNRADLAWK